MTKYLKYAQRSFIVKKKEVNETEKVNIKFYYVCEEDLQKFDKLIEQNNNGLSHMANLQNCILKMKE